MTAKLSDPELEAQLRSTLDAVAAQTAVADALAEDRGAVLHDLGSARPMPGHHRRSLALVGVAAGVLVALVVAAGVVRSSSTPDVVDTPGAPAPASTPAPEGGTWPATPTKYCVGWLDMLNARPQLDFTDTAGRDRFMDGMAALSGGVTAQRWRDRTAVSPAGEGEVGMLAQVIDSAPCLTIMDSSTGTVRFVNPEDADNAWQADAGAVGSGCPSEAPLVVDGPDGRMFVCDQRAAPPVDGESLWPAEAPADYCTGWQRFYDVQLTAPGPTSVQTEGFKRYTAQLAAIAPGDLGPSWLQLRDYWSTPVDPDPTASHELLFSIHDRSMAACPGTGMSPPG